MGGLVVFAIMMIGAFLPFGLVGFWVRTGRFAAAIAFCVLVAGLSGLLGYTASHPGWLNPQLSMFWGMLFMLPALGGALAGALVGAMIRLRDRRQ